MVELDRKMLIDHLNHISCEEEVTEVVLGVDLGANALTPDQAFYVAAPGWGASIDILPEPVGVIDLSLLIKSLAKLANEETVILGYENNRLVLNEGVHTLRLMISDPEVIGTRVQDGAVEQISETLAQGTEVPIPQNIARGILDVQDLLGAMELTLNVGRSGTEILIGPETGHNDAIEWEELKGDESYSLILQANAMVAALKHISDYEDAGIILTGPDSLVGIRASEYMYVLSPTEA